MFSYKVGVPVSESGLESFRGCANVLVESKVVHLRPRDRLRRESCNREE